ncbi:MAG: aspartate carbamoyltransferase catalytic subunit [Paracoccaceae bacterium]
MARRIGFRDTAGDEADAAKGSQGWDGILDRDERILWQGRPDTKIIIGPGNIALLLFGSVFAGFALVWMVLAASAGGGFWAFGLIHFSVGLGIMFAAVFGSRFKRARTWYALSSRRAFIATDMPVVGRKLKSYPITPDSVLQTDGNHPATLHFAAETRRRSSKSGGTYQAPVGFVRIDDGEEVFKLLRRVQRGAV